MCDFDAWDISHEFITAQERKLDEIVSLIKQGKEQIKLNDHIVRIIVLLKRYSLQIEEGYYMGKNGKMHSSIKQMIPEHIILLALWGTALTICRNSIKSPGEHVLLVNFRQCEETMDIAS